MKNNKLEQYEELVGFLEEIEVTDDNVTVRISGYYLVYSTLSDEADFIQKHLKKEDIGRKIGIVFIPGRSTPLAIRWIDETEKRTPSPFMEWYFETYLVGGM